MSPSRVLIPCLVGAGLTWAAAGAAEPVTTKAGSAREHEAFAADRLRPFLTTYCVSCHGAKRQKGGVALHADVDPGAILKNRKLWQNVVANLNSHEMPPANSKQPTAAETTAVVTWVKARLAESGCEGPPDPGRVTMRRLNRAEYNNTIRDLVGVALQPAEDFPSDDVGYGFDNIGDVLSLPPLLMEKYLTAAEQVTLAAIPPPEADPARPRTSRFAAPRLKNSINGPVGEDGFHGLFSEGNVSAGFSASHTAEYAVKIRAYGDQAGTEPAKMALRVDGKDVKVFDVPAVRKAPQVCETKIQLTEGRHRLAAAFVNDYYNPQEKDPHRRDRNLYVEFIEVRGPLGLPPTPPPESQKRIFGTRPDGASDEQYARRILGRFASRAFRRPVSQEEITRLAGFVTQARKEGQPFEDGIRLALQAVLVSPSFLFRVEVDRPADSSGFAPLNEYELASRLSYFLWNSMPDDDLFKAAGNDNLHDPKEFRAQVSRMLRDPKSKALVENFAGQWLQLRLLKTVAPDRKQFRGFNNKLRDAMRTETELFFETVMKEDRSVLDFLDADFTFVNERLARHYGIQGVKGEEFVRVNVPAGQRGGVLTHASILTITSNPTRTSPVKRGKWILENILGTPPPPPPPNVPELTEAKAGALTGTLRQRTEQHRANPNCAVCHQKLDPLGFGFENFDAVGMWRTKDGESPVDASGVLPGGQKFKGPDELKKILLGQKEQFVRCLSEKLLTFALGRGLESSDSCSVDRIAQAVAADNYRFSTVVHQVVQSDPFRKRKAK